MEFVLHQTRWNFGKARQSAVYAAVQWSFGVFPAEGEGFDQNCKCNCNWRICSAPPTISPMAHYTVKLSCLRRSINGRKQIGIEMSLKSRRGSHHLKILSSVGRRLQTRGAATANALSPILFSPSPPNDKVAAAWWSQWWPRRIACCRCQQLGNVIGYLANKRLVYQKAKFVVNTRSNRQPMQLAKGRSHVIRCNLFKIKLRNLAKYQDSDSTYRLRLNWISGKLCYKLIVSDGCLVSTFSISIFDSCYTRRDVLISQCLSVSVPVFVDKECSCCILCENN